MKLSSNVIVIELNKSTVLYNTLSKEIVEMDLSLEQIESGNLTTTNEDYLRSRNYFDNKKESYRKYLNLKNKIKYNQKIMSFIIHTNFTCNLKCDYCYQNNTKNGSRMNVIDSQKVVNFINNRVNDQKPKIVELVFLGGEPLLETTIIKSILDGVQYSKETQYNKSVITNGVLLNDNIVDFLEKYGFQSIQITLDGDKNTHDLFRVKHNGDGTFNEILGNLKKYSEVLPISLNVNLNESNKHNITNLMNTLKKEQVRIHLSFSLVFEIEGYKFSHTLEYKDLTWLNVHKEAIQYGNDFEPFYRNTDFACGLYKINEYNISPDGKIYKCISGIGENEYLISDISEADSIDYHTRMSQFIESNLLQEECIQCQYKVHCGVQCKYKNTEFKCYKNDIIANDIELIRYALESD